MLDEADQLLNTEDAARLYQAKIDLKQQEKLGKPAVKKKKKLKSKSTASKISATQSLLQELEVCQITVDYHAERRYQSKERVQIICASATVGDYHSVRKEEVNKIDWSQWNREDVYEDMACIK